MGPGLGSSSTNPGNNIVLFNLLLYAEGAMEYLMARALGYPVADILIYLLIVRNAIAIPLSVWLAYRNLGALRKVIVGLAYLLAVYSGIVQAVFFYK